MAYRLDRSLTPVADALALLDREGRAVDRVERVMLDEALDRVLAARLVAPSDVPPFARAAMDGYAVVASDTSSATPDRPVRLPVLETVYTGSVPTRDIRSGVCAGIATGAPLPAGADAVVPVEDTERDGDAVSIRRAMMPGQHLAARGSDLRAGEVALDAGTLLTSSRLGVLAAMGQTEADVYARPRVAILSTGDEIVAPGEPLGPGQIYDVNTTTLEAAIRSNGGHTIIAPRTRDDRDALRAAFLACLHADLVLFTGGSSVGERDYVLEIIEQLGDIKFQGLALKPGKPTVFAIVRGTPVFGMPGNPTSCLTNAYLLVVPMLRRMARLPPPIRRSIKVPLASDVASAPARHQIYPVRVEEDRAVPVFKSSGEITSLARADGYFEIPAEVERVAAGTMVTVVLF
jgi:molybdopterin molybdotransferase